MVRARAYLRAVRQGEALFGPAFLLILLILAVVWVGLQPTPREAAGQEKARDTPAREATVPVPEPVEPLLGPLFELPEDSTVAERLPDAIPGLAGMDVIAPLPRLSGASFRCLGAGPAGGGLVERVCTSPAGEEGSAAYEVTVVEEDPATVLWVRADAWDATDEEAAELFGRVADFSLEDTDPLNPEVWVDANVSSGGEYLAEGARLRLYGTEGAKSLEVVGTGLPSDSVPEPRDRSGPKVRDRSP